MKDFHPNQIRLLVFDVDSLTYNFDQENWENFKKFLLIVSQNTDIATNELSYISPLWTYKLLTFLSVAMIVGELFAFLS